MPFDNGLPTSTLKEENLKKYEAFKPWGSNPAGFTKIQHQVKSFMLNSLIKGNGTEIRQEELVVYTKGLQMDGNLRMRLRKLIL